jgi:hypothetical protein
MRKVARYANSQQAHFVFRNGTTQGTLLAASFEQLRLD